jgi:hypothetical protein
MIGMASMWLAVSLLKASLNIMTRSWLNNVNVARVTAAILTINATWLWRMCSREICPIFSTFFAPHIFLKLCSLESSVRLEMKYVQVCNARATNTC